MGDNSGIEWTDSTWTPVTGCTKVSEGCKHCYAQSMARRLQAMSSPHYADGFEVRLHADVLDLPLRWKRPRRIFVTSMGDLFHNQVPDDFIEQVFDVMNAAPHHTFQVLTKRPERLSDFVAAYQTQRTGAPTTPLPNHIWIGTSIENQKRAEERIPHLLRVPAVVRFLSCEPLLGPLDLTPYLPHHSHRSHGEDFCTLCGYLPSRHPSGVNWVIVGGESGPDARPLQSDWVRSLRDQCQHHNVAFFFKQWGGVHRTKAGRLLDGQTWDEMPELNLVRM